MRIGGLQKLTLLDYPGMVACTVFTEGCNFRCPYCHNASLVLPEEIQGNEEVLEDDFFEFLDRRKGKLDGVCVSGGEPLLQPDINVFIKRIKEKGFKVKLDTNGSFPEKLKQLIDDKLIDFVAMDIKTVPDKYSKVCGISNPPIERIKESVELLKQGRIAYEFRTTVVDELHSAEDLKEIGKWIAGADRYFLQNYEDSGDIVGDSNDLHEVPQDKLQQMLTEAKQNVTNVLKRGEE